MSEGCGHGDGKRVHEHVASILPFKVLEAAAGKPLRISGVALTAGLSRNLNVYTPQELEAFASELVNAPMYIEHVAVPNAIGKVTKAFFDSASRCLRYEAEVYDEATAEKIRKGLIQHVSVGADYDALDVVDAKVPHGLHNAELSLVAVPGIPEANIQVLERLWESLVSKGSGKLKMSVKELLEPLVCVFCGQPGEFLVSVCTSCGDKANAAAASQTKEQLDAQVPGEYLLGFYQDPALFLPEHFRLAWLDQANGILAVMAKTKVDPALERCQSILFLKSKWQPNTVADWLKIHPDYQNPANSSASQAVQSGVESLKEEDLKKVVKEALKEQQQESSGEQSAAEKLAAVEASLQEKTSKLAETETKLAEVEGKLADAERLAEDLRKQVPGGGLLKDPPKMMPVSEHISVLEGLLPPVMVERSTMGMQRQCQTIRGAILKAKERLK